MIDADITADTISETPLSLHQRILLDIEQNILTGRWQPGFKIASEQQLALEYGCSRMTVNKVVTQLARAGLIQRRRKVGSVVLPQKAQSAILEIYDIREEVKATGEIYTHRILSRTVRTANSEEAERLDIPRKRAIADITCLHYAGEHPFCLEQRLINLEVVPDARGETFETLSPGPWLLDHVPWSAAEHRIAARGAGPAEAAHLTIPIGSPVMVVERQTWRLDQSVTAVRLTYPGKSHTLTARFTPSQAG
ncbi:histidine utilization repressor [Rhizobium wenxiniae]|uniref:Histidine utilization repressor n=1 Tax=Rhizobium wenxiniae TaxID=1737357 RepID=A0A7X0D1X5_9HYPH|nr:histidine utilization repressor [Rhizobium wenxiniae]MBB6164907.1 GntR family histidine utilization transcriptional repressor [Rhizobium wenxiniae]GGG11126.1 histidine utilization repressor [Rhizobium wenxiniae]